MSQQAKKPASASQASAKIASNAANKMTGVAFSAAESTKAAAQNVLNISSSAARDMLSSGTAEAGKAHQKMWEIGQESMEHITRGADMWSKMCMELIGICRENVEAAIECANVTANLCKNMSSEAAESCNKQFSEAVELGKEAFACRTINDVADLQSKAVKHALDNCFNESNKLCNLAFECATEALEPINECVADASEKLAKVMAA